MLKKPGALGRETWTGLEKQVVLHDSLTHDGEDMNTCGICGSMNGSTRPGPSRALLQEAKIDGRRALEIAPGNPWSNLSVQGSDPLLTQAGSPCLRAFLHYVSVVPSVLSPNTRKDAKKR